MTYFSVNTRPRAIAPVSFIRNLAQNGDLYVLKAEAASVLVTYSTEDPANYAVLSSRGARSFPETDPPARSVC